MRFIKYLNENDIDEIRQELNDNCQPFLKEIRQYKGWDNIFLFSGRKTSKDWFEGSVRQNRNPLDTPLEIHWLLDKQFKKKFGVKARSNSIFCFSEYITTQQYGNPYYIFPIGKYKTIWSNEIKDLYIYLKRELGPTILEGFDSLSKEDKINALKHLEALDIPSLYTDKSHVKIKRPYTEVMLHCKEYIAINCYYLRRDKGIHDIWGVIDEIL